MIYELGPSLPGAYCSRSNNTVTCLSFSLASHPYLPTHHSDKMRAGNLVLITLLQAVSTALGAPAPSPQDAPPAETDAVPSDPLEALNQLQALGEATAEQIKEEVSEAVTRRSGASSGCTLSKLQVRREWYVFWCLRSHSYPLLY